MAIRIRKSAVATVDPVGPQEIIISHLDDSIALGNGTDLFTSSSTGGKVALDVAVVDGIVSGSFTTAGLQNGIKTTALTVTDVPTKIPSTAFFDRNTMSVRVWGANTVYFGEMGVTSTSGYPKKYLEEISMDIKDNVAVDLYAVCATGQSSEVRIIEIA